MKYFEITGVAFLFGVALFQAFLYGISFFLKKEINAWQRKKNSRIGFNPESAFGGGTSMCRRVQPSIKRFESFGDY